MSKLRFMGRDPNSSSRARPSSRIPEPASRTISSPSERTSTQLVLPPYRTVPGPGTGIEPRTPHSFSCVDDGGTPDIFNRQLMCHVTVAKPRVFAQPGFAVTPQKESCPEPSFGAASRETAIAKFKRADDEAALKKPLRRKRR